MTDQPYLGRCKECDYALFSTPDDVKTASEARDVRAGTGAWRWNNMVLGRCNNGHRWFALKRIKGTYSKDHKCDSRCLNAKGHDCTCSCGGANHGRGHAVQVVEASAIVTTEAAATDKQEAFIRRLIDERIIPDNDYASGGDRKAAALAKLDKHSFTKRQASATIEWLLTLPKVES